MKRLWLWLSVPYLLIFVASCIHSPIFYNFKVDGDYAYLASQIRHHVPYGLHYTFDGVNPNVGIQPLRPPLYPLLIVPFLFVPWLFIAFQVALSVLMLYILWVYLSNRYGKESATLPIILAALHWPYIFGSVVLSADNVFTFFVVLAVIQTLENRMFSGGVLWSLAILTKPVVFFLPILLSLAFWRTPKRIATWLVVIYFVPLLWCAHNKIVSGKFVYTGQNQVQVTGAVADGIASLSVGEYFSGKFKESGPAIRYVASHPILAMRYFANNSAKYFLTTQHETLIQCFGIKPILEQNNTGKLSGNGTIRTLGKYPLLTVPFVFFTYLLLVLYSYFIGSIQWDGARSFVLYSSILWLWILGSLASGSPRYRVPIIPLMAISIAKKGES